MQGEVHDLIGEFNDGHVTTATRTILVVKVTGSASRSGAGGMTRARAARHACVPKVPVRNEYY